MLPDLLFSFFFFFVLPCLYSVGVLCSSLRLKAKNLQLSLLLRLRMDAM